MEKGCNNSVVKILTGNGDSDINMPTLFKGESLRMTTYTSALPAMPIARNWGNTLLQVLGASLFIALCAQINIPLYFTPVPLSGQVFAVMLTGGMLGSRKGVLAVVTYMLQGAMGLPVFAGGSYGLLSLLGPTGGYFIGFAAQAYIAGFLAMTKEATSVKVINILLLSCAVQLALGTAWLCLYTGMNLSMAFSLGFLPFILGDILKCVGVTAYLKFSSAHAAYSHL